MHLFYQPDFAHTHALSDEEAFHAAKVLRLRQGEPVRVTDGKGCWFDATIQQCTSKRCDLDVSQQIQQQPRPFSIEIALAPTKNLDRIEWFVEKATEIGINKISFFYSKHSERRTIKLERLHKIAISAMKQSLQAYLPQIIEVGDFEKYLPSIISNQKFIAHLPQQHETPSHLFAAAVAMGSYTVLIGPEGDFTQNELILAQKLGFKNVVLGQTRLRTETAALIACQTLNTLNI